MSRFTLKTLGKATLIILAACLISASSCPPQEAEWVVSSASFVEEGACNTLNTSHGLVLQGGKPFGSESGLGSVSKCAFAQVVVDRVGVTEIGQAAHMTGTFVKFPVLTGSVVGSEHGWLNYRLPDSRDSQPGRVTFPRVIVAMAPRSENYDANLKEAYRLTGMNVEFGSFGEGANVEVKRCCFYPTTQTLICEGMCPK